MACLKIVEDSTRTTGQNDIISTIQLAKFAIHCKAGDIDAADANLRGLMKQQTLQYDVVLNAVLDFTESCGQQERITEFFKLLASRFSK